MPSSLKEGFEMYYIKWNCYDMAEQREEIEYCRRELSEAYDELNAVYRRLDEDVASFGIGDDLRKALSDIENVIADLGAEQTALDQAIDIYYSAETLANEQSESLPTKIGALIPHVYTAATVNAAFSGGASARETVGQSMIMEDWLAALVYWRNQMTGNNIKVEG